jgi:hypothetical protein
MAGRGQRRAHIQLTSPAAVSSPVPSVPSCALLSPLAPSFFVLLPTLSRLTPLQVTEARRRPPESTASPPKQPNIQTAPSAADSAPATDSGQLECSQYLLSIQMTVLGTYLHQERIAGKRHQSSLSIHGTPSPRHDTHRFLLSGGIRFKESRAWIRLIHSLRD